MSSESETFPDPELFFLTMRIRFNVGRSVSTLVEEAMTRGREKDLHLGEYLRSLKEQGVSFSSIAKRARIPTSTLSAWAGNQRPTDFAALKRLSEALGKSVSFLLYGEDDQVILQSSTRQLLDLFDGRFEIEIHVKKIVEPKKPK